jgi:hypothetical protein
VAAPSAARAEPLGLTYAIGEVGQRPKRPLCFATIIALSNSDIAPKEEGILGIKAMK